MKTITLDVHSGVSQMSVAAENGEIVFELPVPSTPEALRQVIGAIAGPKRVIMENGPLSALIHDALQGLAEEVMSCDPARNALIARAEDANDERDARRLALLDRAGALRAVYVPPEPYRTLRSLTCYDAGLARELTMVKNRVKGLCRRYAIKCRGQSVYNRHKRTAVLQALPAGGLRWQMASLYRRLAFGLRERREGHREMRALDAQLPVIARLQTMPGVGRIIARTVVVWIVDPGGFKNRNALSSYAGLGLGQGWTNWKPVGPARAARRGQRALKRVLFLAARAALRGENAFSLRSKARREAGWEDRKAIRDVARQMLLVMCRLWRKGMEYEDELARQQSRGTKCERLARPEGAPPLVLLVPPGGWECVRRSNCRKNSTVVLAHSRPAL
jgi:transposase